MEPQKPPKYFLESVSLPLHMSMLEEMPWPEYAERFSDCKSTRSSQHSCAFFYKNICRMFPLSIEEGGDDRG